MNPDKYENKGKILKVIYYDENAAMDYVTIMNDGNITIEEINKAIEGKNNEIGVNGEASIKKSFLKMLNFDYDFANLKTLHELACGAYVKLKMGE